MSFLSSNPNAILARTMAIYLDCHEFYPHMHASYLLNFEITLMAAAFLIFANDGPPKIGFKYYLTVR